MGYNVLGDVADFGLLYQHETVATTERFLREHPETARRFLRAFIAGIHLWMTEDKKTKEILTKRLKILDETYVAYEKLTEKKPYPTPRVSNFRSTTWRKRIRKPKTPRRRITSISPC